MTMTQTHDADQATTDGRAWSYQQAFSRNIGIISDEEQSRLRESRVAIAGMGGVGGVHFMTLVRLGVGKFTIADPDTFELANFNRQYGATTDSIGEGKAQVMADRAVAINPELDIRVLSEPVSRENVGQFLDGAQLFVDGLDFFVMDARRMAFRAARERGIWAITAGPHAMSTAWVTFSPGGMSFDRYFDLCDDMDPMDALIAFAIGCVPSALHLKYLDLSKFFQPDSGKGASMGLACQLASGVVGAQALKILLERPGLKPAPWSFQFDAYRQLFAKKHLLWGNRHPLQKIKRRWLRRMTSRG